VRLSCHTVSYHRTDLSRDIQVLKTYGAAPYAAALKSIEKQIKEKQESINEKIGVKESDTVSLGPSMLGARTATD